MTAHDYLNQVYYLNRKIKYNLSCLDDLREQSCIISSPSWGDKVSGTKSNDAPFVRALEKIWEQEELINAEIERLNALKKEIQGVIEQLTDVDERFVLLYRYIKSMTWNEIALEINLSEATVRRLYRRAMKKIVVPK